MEVELWDADDMNFRRIEGETLMRGRRPRMILFDYGGTILCEPDWDYVRGERAVFAHVTENPHGVTPEELGALLRGGDGGTVSGAGDTT